ncbi:MAG: hypothetical protein Q8L66_02115 [Caulobacter sp.]|nr:hypothetical protein [Caulobacter sp.]
MTLKRMGLALLIGAVVVPGAFFSLIALAPEPTAEEIVQARAAEEVSRARQAAAAEKAKSDAVREVIEATRWRYAKRSFDTFRQSLMDPYSAQFRDVWAVQFGDGGMGVCGVVNAKNALGAYVGERPFIAVGDVSWTPDHPNFAGQFQAICLNGEKVERIRT